MTKPHDTMQHFQTTRCTALHKRAEAEGPLPEEGPQLADAISQLFPPEDVHLRRALLLARIADGKHYLDFGCSSFKEFADRYLPVEYSSTKKYIQIGRKFAPLFTEFKEADTNPSSLLPGGNPENGEIMEVGRLGYKKLLELTRVEDAVFTDVVEAGKLVMPDGEAFTIEELRKMAVREFSDTLERAQAKDHAEAS